MRVLGIDTATWRASVGLCIDGTIVAERSQLTDGSHAVSLLPLIDAVLRDVGCGARSLDAVAVSGGPGSFTGLRVGLSVAKGLARAAGLHVVAVPTLEALARTVADDHDVICTLLDARRGELYAACFASSANGFRRLMSETLVTPEVLLEMLPIPCVILGDAVVRYGSFLRERLGAAVTVLDDETHGPRGGMVASMGAEQLEHGTTTQLCSLEPFYIRPPGATLKAP